MSKNKKLREAINEAINSYTEDYENYKSKGWDREAHDAVTRQSALIGLWLDLQEQGLI